MGSFRWNKQNRLLLITQRISQTWMVSQIWKIPKFIKEYRKSVRKGIINMKGIKEYHKYDKYQRILQIWKTPNSKPSKGIYVSLKQCHRSHRELHFSNCLECEEKIERDNISCVLCLLLLWVWNNHCGINLIIFLYCHCSGGPNDQALF
jgi:hypothetical protein